MKKLICAAMLVSLVAFPAAASAASSQETAKKVEQLKQSALELLTDGKYNKAVGLLREALAINPSDKTAARYLLLSKRLIVEPLCKQAADAYLSRDYQKAIDVWENILKVNPEDRRVWTLIDSTKNLLQDKGVAAMYATVDKLIKEERYQPAIHELEKILTISPDERKAVDLLKTTTKAMNDKAVKERYDKADQFMKQKRYDLAVEQWREVLKLDPDQEAASRLIATTIRSYFLDSIYSKAEKLFTEGDYVSSLEHYNKILVDNPTDQYVRKVLERLNNVMKISPRMMKKGEVWDMLRKAFENYISMEGNPRVAIVAVWYAAQLEPENGTAGASRDFLERELVGTVRSIEYPVRDMNIVDQYLFAALNNIYSGRYDLAVQECSLILGIQPNNVLALKRLGSAYFAMKNKEKARESWERALKIAPDDAELKKFINQAK